MALQVQILPRPLKGGRENLSLKTCRQFEMQLSLVLRALTLVREG